MQSVSKVNDALIVLEKKLASAKSAQEPGLTHKYCVVWQLVVQPNSGYHFEFDSLLGEEMRQPRFRRFDSL